MTKPQLSSKVLLVITQTYGTMAMQFIAIMVISRILTPAQIGIFSIGSILFSVISYLRDFGIGTYVLRVENLTEASIRNATGLNLLTTVAAGFLLWQSAPIAASYYKQDSVADVINILAVSCLVIGLGTMPMARHRRDLNLLPQFWVAIAQTVFSVAVSIYLAVDGLGSLALAYGHLAGMAAATVTAWLLRPKDFPILPAFRGFSPILKVGTGIVWINVLDRIGKGFPELVIARSVGIESSALFSRGNGLIDIFRNGLENITTSVSLPYYSQQHRDGTSLRIATRQTLDFALAVGWPFAAVLAVLAPAILELLFGHQWIGAADYLRILCIALLVELLVLPAKDILVACGGIRVAARMLTSIHIARIALVLGSAGFGALPVCWSLVAAGIGNACLAYWNLQRTIGITGNDIWIGIRLPLLIGGGTGGMTWGAWMIVSAWPLWMAFGAALATSVIAWGILVFATRHPLRREIVRQFAAAVANLKNI